MGKALRWSEQWFTRGLWLVAVVFAGFLIGLGGTIVGDLPKVEKQRTLDDFLDRPAANGLRLEVQAAQRAAADAQEALEQARLQLQVARADVAAGRASFQNWLATRHATQAPSQDPEVLDRTRQLDTLHQADRRAQATVQAQEQAVLDARQREARARRTLGELERAASERLARAQRSAELRVFLYRLALTLPLLLVAGWLFRHKRHGAHWPFVWGFIGFALFAFFVELVPYLPSYGGYVRYTVGIVVTAVVGRQAILALARYRERQKLAEGQPEAERREALAYDTALARLGKGVCPGCERRVDLQDGSIDFCPHCGIGLFDRCGACRTRKSAFAHFCHACGTPGRAAAPFTPLVPGPAGTA